MGLIAPCEVTLLTKIHLGQCGSYPPETQSEHRLRACVFTGRSCLEGAPVKTGEKTAHMGIAPIETAHHLQWGRLLTCRARTCQVVVRTIVGVRKIKSSCFDTFSVLFLNNQPSTGIRDRYGMPATLFDCVSTKTPPMTIVSPSRTST